MKPRTATRPHHDEPANRKTWLALVTFDLGRTAGAVADGLAIVTPTRWRASPPAARLIEPTTEGFAELEWYAHDFVIGLGLVGETAPWQRDATAAALTANDIAVLAKISGLADAVEDMRAAAMRHEGDPVLVALVAKLDALGPDGRQATTRDLMARLRDDPVVHDFIAQARAPRMPLAREDCDRLARALAFSLRRTLRDLDVSARDVAHLQLIVSDVCRPALELLELYARPKTTMQQLKRYWRLHRIALRLLSIASRARRVGGPFPVSPIRTARPSVTSDPLT